MDKNEWQKEMERGLAPVTPEEFDRLTKTKDQEAACHFIFDKAHWKWTEHGDAVLTTGERTVLAVETFFGEGSNGGLVQFLENESGAYAQHLPEALERVGLTAYAPIARELRALFPDGISPDPEARFDQIDSLDEEQAVAMEELEDRFFELYLRKHAVEEFRQKLAAYIRSHREEFVREP